MNWPIVHVSYLFVSKSIRLADLWNDNLKTDDDIIDCRNYFSYKQWTISGWCHHAVVGIDIIVVGFKVLWWHHNIKQWPSPHAWHNESLKIITSFCMTRLAPQRDANRDWKPPSLRIIRCQPLPCRLFNYCRVIINPFTPAAHFLLVSLTSALFRYVYPTCQMANNYKLIRMWPCWRIFKRRLYSSSSFNRRCFSLISHVRSSSNS